MSDLRLSRRRWLTAAVALAVSARAPAWPTTRQAVVEDEAVMDAPRALV